MGLKDVERRLERMVEGAFSRAFRSGLRPIELGRRVTRVLDEERTVDVRGRIVVPNRLTFTLATEDAQRFASINEALRREISEVAREHAADRQYGFMGPIDVNFATDPALRPGRFELVAELQEAGTPIGGRLIRPDGLGETLTPPTVIGRLDECDIALGGANVSRRHAQITLEDGLVLTDLGSTNGTLVNGSQVVRHTLRHGDIITIGDHHLRFEVD